MGRLTRIWRTLHPAAAAAEAEAAATAAAAAGFDGEGGCTAGNLDAPSAPGNQRGRRQGQGRVGARSTSAAASATSSGLAPASRRPPLVSRVRSLVGAVGSNGTAGVSCCSVKEGERGEWEGEGEVIYE